MNPQAADIPTEKLLADFRATLERVGINIAANTYDRQALQPSRKTLERRTGWTWKQLKQWAESGAEPIIPENNIEYVPSAPIQLKTYAPPKGKRSPEDQVFQFSDHHGGLITPTFNPDIYKSRLDELFTSGMTITELHRNLYPINDAWVLFTGDMVQGENPRQGSKIGHVACGAKDQIYQIALPYLRDVLLSLKQNFKTVHIRGVQGNHGIYSKEAPGETNWDSFLYKALESELKQYAGFDIQFSDQFYQIVDIAGFKFFLFHGNQVRTNQGIPWFGLKRKIMSWADTFRGFHYAMCGHWHECNNMSITRSIRLIMGGSMVSDEPFALEAVGTSSTPEQWTFGMHRKYGMTWRYPLVVDEDFLPGS